jgi:hypothetical protein
MNNRDNSQTKSNNGPPMPADEALADELLADLDVESGAEPEALSPTDLAELGMADPSSPIAGFAGAIEARKAREAEDYEARGNKMRQDAAAAERKKYRENVNPNPRAYNKHPEIAPQQIASGETPDEYKRRYKRDLARTRRGVTAEQIEANAAARQAMTPEDRKRKKAEADAARRAAMTPEQRKATDKRRTERRAEKKEREAAAAQAQIAARAIFPTSDESK